ncbi:MAG: carboxylesterase family protein [Saprospiraceae bacterium]
MKKLLLPFIFIICYLSLAGQVKRYTEAIFPSSTVTPNVVYDTAPFLSGSYGNESTTETGDLVMDIYEPTGDTHNQRAAIVFAHAGGFITGNRNHDDMVAFCDSFARKGYVTVTFDYRQGMYFLLNTDMHSTRAAFRGLQDGRSAVRYLRANAASLGIDPDQVYLAGSSAGAFIALHSIYMTDISEKPAFANEVNYTNLVFPFFHTAPDLGPFDRGSNLSESGTPNGIISLWGAVADVDLISAAEDEPIFMAHGSDDGTVPFDSGAPFGVSLFPDVYGSNLINNELNNVGVTNKETYFLTGEDHEFYGTSNGTWTNGTGGNMFWDSILLKSSNFLWLQHKPAANFTYAAGGLQVDFTDLTTEAVGWFWDFGDGNTSVLQDPSHTYSAYGSYDASLFVTNDILSWDEINMSVDLFEPLPLTWTTPLKAKYNNGETDLKWSVAEQFNNEKFVIEHSRNGSDFESIGELKVLENLQEEIDFYFYHNNTPTGVNYYRIKQIDFDGMYSFSSIAAVEVAEERGVVSFFPNPSLGIISFELGTSESKIIEIYNLQGILMRTELIENGDQLDLSNLAKGMYFVKNKNGEIGQKLITE